MYWIRQHLRRVLTDAAGYLLLLAALLTGWLPGPGGIPLALAGLGLLSIHNAWARRIREYLLVHGSGLVQRLFPDRAILQWVYDSAVIALLGFAALTWWQRGSRWQVIVAGIAVGLAIGIGLANRRRFQRITATLKRKR
jgi:hypothetical protein